MKLPTLERDRAEDGRADLRHRLELVTSFVPTVTGGLSRAARLDVPLPQLAADPDALAIDLIGCRAEVLQDLGGERQGDLALAREDDVGAGLARRARLPPSSGDTVMKTRASAIRASSSTARCVASPSCTRHCPFAAAG